MVSKKLEKVVRATRELDRGYGASPKEVRDLLHSQDDDPRANHELQIKKAVRLGVLEVVGGRLRTHSTGPVEELLRMCRQVNHLATRMDEMDQASRANNVRVYGLRSAACENPVETATDFFRQRLGVQVDPDRIEHAERVGYTNDGRPRPLLVRFVSQRDRRKVFNRRHVLRNTGMAIGEDLSPGRREMLEAARTLHGPSNAWTRDGQVFWKAPGGRVLRANRLQDITAYIGVEEDEDEEDEEDEEDDKSEEPKKEDSENEENNKDGCDDEDEDEQGGNVNEEDGELPGLKNYVVSIRHKRV